MPRSASPPFNYSVPSGTAAVSGQVISSVAYNNFLADLTNNGLNAAWPIAYGGTGTTDGSALVPDGSAATPAVRFQNETNSGIYRVAAGQIGISILGSNVVTVTASGISFNGITSTGTIISTGSSVGYTSFQGISTEAAAALGPIDESFRNSASPAANDLLGGSKWYGNSSTAVKREYVGLDTGIVDATNAAERGFANFYTIQNGGRNLSLAIGASGTNSTATAAGTTTLTKLSAPVQKFTGSSTQTVVLPAVSELFIGQAFDIWNLSTGAVTVQSSGAGTVAVVSPGLRATFTSNANSGTGASVWDYRFGGTLTLGTAVASTSGTSIDFVGIPSWVKRMTVNFSSVSTSGTDNWIVQIGDSGGIESTGYGGTGAGFDAGGVSPANSTAGFLIRSGNAGNSVHGSVVLCLLDSSTNTWVATGSLSLSTATFSMVLSGSKALSPGPLDRLRITTTGGTNTFDAGLINVMWEG